MILLNLSMYASAAASLVSSLVFPSILILSSPTSNTKEYVFGGASSVQVEREIKLQGRTLTDPQFIGAGGGGAVFTYRQSKSQPSRREQQSPTLLVHPQHDDDVVVKFSWLQSAESVANECSILKIMEGRHVPGVERCMAQMDYQPDPRRTVIVMEPYLEDAASSLSELSPDIAQIATQNLIQTAIEMLKARVVTIDVQPLISKRTGELILIDMTEAILLRDDGLSSMEKAVVTEFCSEIAALVPETWLEDASKTFACEMSRIEHTSGIPLQEDVRTILETMLTPD
jgi:hypothetical protein